MIVITGATGQLGQQVVSALLRKVPANQLAVTVRNPEKAKAMAQLGVTIRVADYNQAGDWKNALDGADKVLLISSSDVGRRVQQHQAVIDAAIQAKVKCLAYTSILHAHTSSLALAEEHKVTESAIKASGVPYVMLRNGWYTENYTAQIEAILSQKAIYGCAGEGKIASASRCDYAEAAAKVLVEEGHEGKVYELAGDHAFTMTDFANLLATHLGFHISYHNLPQQAYKVALINAGLPEAFAGLLADADRGVAEGELFETNQVLSQLIGRPTTSLEIGIQHALKSLQAG